MMSVPLFRRAAYVMVVALSVVTTGCGESVEARLAKAASITMIPSTVSIAALGETVQLEVVARDGLGNEIANAVVDLTSSDGNVATVGPNGLVTAVGAGTAEIIAAIDTLIRTSDVAVTQVATQITKVSGDAQSETVTLALTAPLVVQVNDNRDNPIANVPVTFTVNQPTASLSAGAVTTGADGRASTSLTLGTVAGEVYEVRARADAGNAPVTLFRATGLADDPTAAVAASGNAQRQPAGSILPTPLEVRVTDQFGNGVAGRAVTFSVTSGNGSVNPGAAQTDATGLARTTWTLGATQGPQSVDADAGLTAPVTFTAEGTDLAITTVGPATLIEGQLGQITGTGFDANLANVTVLVDGFPAQVTASTLTTIDFTVPLGACKPAQNVNVVVTTTSGGTTPPVSHGWAPGQTVNLAVGAYELIQDPARFCLQFLSNAANEEYLLVVQNASSIPSTRTLARVAATAAGAPSVVTAPRVASPTAQPPIDPRTAARSARWRLHREAETELRDAQLQAIASRAATPTGARTTALARIDSTVQVGTVVSMKVPDFRAGMNSCNNSATISATVRAVGTRGIFLSDTENPSDGFTDQDFQSLSNQFDTGIYAADVAYFGAPSDRDENGRVVVLITGQINRWSQNVLGFVSPADLLGLGNCASSNEAEVFYGRAPDGQGILGGGVYPRQAALDDAPALIGHELAHVIQFSRRLALDSNSTISTFMAEGLAVMAEEVVGHAIIGNSPGQNYSYALAFQQPGSRFYAEGLTDVHYYFGRNPSQANVSIPDAPNLCSWVQRFGTPCEGRSLWYGVAWSFLRWLSDQYGSAFAGGEQELNRALTGTTATGFTNITSVVNVPLDSLLAHWATALYVDNRITGLAPRISIPSWNYFDIFVGNAPGMSSRLTPLSRSFSTFSETIEVIAASAAYYLISGLNRPATSVRVRSGNDGVLPAHMQIVIVRTQ